MLIMEDKTYSVTETDQLIASDSIINWSDNKNILHACVQKVYFI